MSQNRTDTAVVESCAYALGNLSFECEVNISFIVACRGAELVGVLAAFQIAGDNRCPAQAHYALTNLCFQNDGNKRKVGLARSLVAVSCIRRWLTLCVALAGWLQVMLDNLQNVELLLAAFRLMSRCPTEMSVGGEIHR